VQGGDVAQLVELFRLLVALIMFLLFVAILGGVGFALYRLAVRFGARGRARAQAIAALATQREAEQVRGRRTAAEVREEAARLEREVGKTVARFDPQSGGRAAGIVWTEGSEDAPTQGLEDVPEGDRDRPIAKRCPPGKHHVAVWPRCFNCNADVREEPGEHPVRLVFPFKSAGAVLDALGRGLEHQNAELERVVPGEDPLEAMRRSDLTLEAIGILQHVVDQIGKTVRACAEAKQDRDPDELAPPAGVEREGGVPDGIPLL
jgi:hypothetical protein